MKITGVIHPAIGYISFNQPVEEMPEDLEADGAYSVPSPPSVEHTWSYEHKAWVLPKADT